MTSAETLPGCWTHYPRQILTQLLEGIIEFSDNGVILTNARQEILFVNQAFTLITGYPEEEVRGKTPQLLKSGQHDSAHYHKMWNAIHQTGYWQGVMTNKKRDGSFYTEWLSIMNVRNTEGETDCYLGIMQNLSIHEDKQEIIEYLKKRDAMTALMNREAIIEQLSAMTPERRSRVFLAVIDIDHFYFINEKYSSSAGDQVIKAVARELTVLSDRSDQLARIGADKYLWVGQEDSRSRVEEKFRAIRNLISRKYALDTQVVDVSVSIGIEYCPQGFEDAHAMLRNAEQALIQGRKTGYGRVQVFNHRENFTDLDEIDLTRELGEALEHDQLELYYQPKCQLDNGKLAGVEALIRWNHPQRGLLTPNLFIPLAERFGLINRLGYWVIEQACHQLQQWRNTAFSDISIAINMSVQQLMDPHVIHFLKSCLERYRINRGLEIELTESVILSQERSGLNLLEQISAMGILLNIDDFGTGYSNFSYLRKMPVRFLKIDRSFVTDIEHNKDDQMIVRSILAIGHGLGMQVIAEGVENTGQRDWLRHQQCDLYQGYLLSRPQPLGELESWLSKQF